MNKPHVTVRTHDGSLVTLTREQAAELRDGLAAILSAPPADGPDHLLLRRERVVDLTVN